MHSHYSDSGHARVSVAPLLGGEAFTATTDLLEGTSGISSTVNLAGPPDGEEVYLQEICETSTLTFSLTFLGRVLQWLPG